jgi:hypothetical protein
MIFIIDSYGFASVGHFWPASNNLIYAFRSLGKDVTFINPSASACISEQRNMHKKINFRNSDKTNLYPAEIVYKSDKSFLKAASDLILEQRKLNKGDIQIVFSWLPQFNSIELDAFYDSVVDKVEGIAAISNFSTDYVLGKKFKEKLTHEILFSKIPVKKKILWVWTSENFSDCNQLIRSLPEFHTTSVSAPEIKRREGVGFYGILSPFRGIGEFLLVSLFNPKTTFIAQGAGYHWSRTWRPFKLRIMRYRKAFLNPPAFLISVIVSSVISFIRLRKNVKFTYQPFFSENELEVEIASREAIFYASKLPLSSGIVLTSLASGTPVIWLGSKGPLVDLLLKKFPEGRLRYWEMFIPNRVRNKLKILKSSKAEAVYTFDDYRNELNLIL